MFKTRLISGIVLVAVALLTIISGGYVLFFTLLWDFPDRNAGTL